VRAALAVEEGMAGGRGAGPGLMSIMDGRGAGVVGAMWMRERELRLWMMMAAGEGIIVDKEWIFEECLAKRLNIYIAPFLS
jgi:hypothetical protein